MELKWLEDFLVLAETRSFSRAAEERNVTQSAFSRRIRQLEQWLGVDLVDRSSYPTTLTAAGGEFRETADEVVRALRQQRALLRARRARGEGSISIVSLHVLTTSFFPGWLKGVIARHGAVWPRLRVENFHDAIQALVDGAVDFMLTMTHPKVPVLLDPLRYPSLALGTDRLVAVAAPGPDGRPLIDPGAGDGDIPFLAYTPESFLGRLTEVTLAGFADRERLTPVFENPMADALKAMALLGHGIAWLPAGSITAELAHGTLVALPDLPEATMDIRLFRSPQKSRPLVERFWTALEGDYSTTS